MSEFSGGPGYHGGGADGFAHVVSAVLVGLLCILLVVSAVVFLGAFG